MIFAATPPYDGTLAGFYKLPADLCYILPESVSMEEGALMEPLSVAVMAIKTIGQMPLGANVVVFGAGPVGLLTMAVAKALGARSVLAIDIQEPRLQFAKQYAATDYCVPTKMQEGEARLVYSRRQAEEIRAKFGYEERGPKSVDLIVDATGAEICVQTALYLAGHGATYVQVGMGADSLNIPISTVLNKELTIKGSFRYVLPTAFLLRPMADLTCLQLWPGLLQHVGGPRRSRRRQARPSYHPSLCRSCQYMLPDSFG